MTKEEAGQEVVPIHEAQDLIYIRMPKCGSSSMIKSIGKNTQVTSEQAKASGKPVFTMLRSPYVRLLSCWADKSNYKRYPQYGITKDISFADFVALVCGLTDDQMDMHFRPMATSIAMTGLEVDFYLRLDYIGYEWPIIVSKYSVKTTFRKRRTSEHAHWKTYYTAALRELVSTRYSDDFDFRYPGII